MVSLLASAGALPLIRVIRGHSVPPRRPAWSTLGSGGRDKIAPLRFLFPLRLVRAQSPADAAGDAFTDAVDAPQLGL